MKIQKNNKYPFRVERMSGKQYGMNRTKWGLVMGTAAVADGLVLLLSLGRLTSDFELTLMFRHMESRHFENEGEAADV